MTTAPPSTSSRHRVDENVPPARPVPSIIPANSIWAPILPQQSYTNPRHYLPSDNVQQHLQHPQGYYPQVYLDNPYPNYVSNPSQNLYLPPIPSSSASNISTYTASPYITKPNYGHYPTASSFSSSPTYGSLDQPPPFPPSQPPQSNHPHYY